MGEGLGDLVDGGLILLHDLLELLDLLGEFECLASEGVDLGGGEAKGGGEGLVDFVVGEPFGFLGELDLFRGYGEGSESLCGLPRGEVDDGLGRAEGRGPRAGLQEGEVAHGVAREPREDEADKEENAEEGEKGEADAIQDGVRGWCLLGCLCRGGGRRGNHYE